MRTLGFSDGEIDLYMRLLELGEATIAECLKRLDISRPHAYTLMRTLLNKGLIAEVPGKPSRFRVLPPEESFISLSTKRIQELDETKKKVEEGMSLLKAKAQSLYKKVDFPAETDAEFIILKGYRHVVDWMTRFYGMTKDSLRIMTCPPSGVDLFMGKPGSLDAFTVKKKFPAKILATESMLDDERFKKFMHGQIVAGNFELKVAPKVPIKMSFYDDFAGVIILNTNLVPEDFVIVIIRNTELLGFFVQAYDCAWDRARSVPLDELA